MNRRSAAEVHIHVAVLHHEHVALIDLGGHRLEQLNENKTRTGAGGQLESRWINLEYFFFENVACLNMGFHVPILKIFLKRGR